MLPVIDNGCATTLSAAEAAQYAPEAPLSLINATVGLPADLMASAISADATGAPPGESISIKIAFIASFFSASSINSLKSEDDVTESVQRFASSVKISPLIFIFATLPNFIPDVLKNPARM